MVPKRIRLLQSCFKFKYEEVSKTLATDKELRDLQHLRSKIEKGYVKMVGATELCSTCNHGSNCICEENNRFRLKEAVHG